MNEEVVRIPLSQLDPPGRDLRARVRGRSQHHIDSLVLSQSEDWPPLLVRRQRSGRFEVVSGDHRLGAAEQLELKDLPCVVLPGGAGFEQAFVANAEHGLAYTLDDRREAARRFHALHPEWSLRQLGRQVGLHHETVRIALAPDSGAVVGENDNGDAAGWKPQPAMNFTRRLVRELVRADDVGEGRVLRLFGDRRAAHIGRVLDEYREDERQRVARLLDVWGRACVAAAADALQE